MKQDISGDHKAPFMCPSCGAQARVHRGSTKRFAKVNGKGTRGFRGNLPYCPSCNWEMAVVPAGCADE